MSLSPLIQYLEADGTVLTSNKVLFPELHDYLSDNADPENLYWEFIKTSELLTKVNSIFNKTNHGFYFAALWVGYKAVETKKLSYNEFTELFKNNKIKTQTAYLIQKHA
jgi:hypothetical protein